MAEKPKFNPNKKFEVVESAQGSKPKFDASKPFQPLDQSDMGFLEGVARSAYEQLPALGGMAGGMLGTFAGPAGTIGGAAGGAYAGQATKNLLKNFVEGQVPSRQEIYAEPFKQAVYGAGAEAGGQLGAKAVSKVGEKLITPIARNFSNILGSMSKTGGQGADKLIQASQRLDIEPTRGMISQEPMIQRLESGLAQTATPAGNEMLEKLQNVGKKMSLASEQVLAPGRVSSNAIQRAGAAKGLMRETLEKKVQPAIDTYRKIESDVKFIDIPDQSKIVVSRNIERLPYAKITGTQESSFAKQISDNLLNVKTLDELRNLKTYVGSKLNDQTLAPSMKNTAGEVYEKLSKMEQSSITRAALQAAKNKQHGISVAKELINEIKDANKIYSEASKKTKAFASQIGLGKVRNYSDFLRKIEQVPDEKFMAKVFQPQNMKSLAEFERQFPKAYSSMKESYMADLYEKSVTKGEISVPKLLGKVKSLSPQFREFVFGKGANQKLKDIESVYNKTYQKVGPSGTPEGLNFVGFSILKPTTWFQSLEADVTKWILDNPGKLKKAERLLKPNDPMSVMGPDKSGGLIFRTGTGLLNSNSQSP